MKGIYITGFMGAGKSTIGKKLAESMNLPVIDTDVWIEQQVGKTISFIFKEDGEQTFREYERKCLQSLPTENIIITTGGGIVTQESNRQWMKVHGQVIYLHCEPKAIFNRLQADQSRPLLAENKMEKIEILLKQRLGYYNEADIIIDTTKKQIKEIVNEIIEMVK